MPLRFDIARLEEPRIDHNGYLQADAVLTRAGVFIYHRADGSVTRELRPPEEVFSEDSLSTLKFRPVTDNHPVIGKLDATNTRELSRGMVVSEPRRDGDEVIAKVLVTDQKTIEKIMRKKNPIREVSCGYQVELVREDGEYNGERYDHKQTKIVYNHVALVRKGRAGTAKLRVDAEDAAAEDIKIEARSDIEETEDKIHVPKRSADDFQDGSFRTIQAEGVKGVQIVIGKPKGQNTTEAQKFIFDKSQGWTLEKARKWVDSHTDRQDYREDHAMTIKIKRDAVVTSTFKLDAFTITVDSEDAEKDVAPALERLDAAIEHIKKLEAENAQQKGRIDELVEKAELPPERLDQLGQERADILGVAHHVGLTNIETLRNDEIKKMVVHKVNPKMNLDAEGQDYINGRYDSIVDNIRKNNKAIKSLAQLRQITRADDYLKDGEEDTRSPRQQFVEDTNNLWMGEEERKQLSS